MKYQKFLALSLLLLVSCSTGAFEVNEFHSGMGIKRVKELLGSWNFDRVQEFSGNALVAYDFPDKGSYRQFTFIFCNERLVELEQEIKPNLKNFILMSSNYNKLYGQPMKVDATNNVLSIGEKNQLALFWRNGGDLIGLKIVLLPPNDQIISVYQSPNSCWQVPH